MRTKRFVWCPPRAIVAAAVVLFVPSVVVSQGISPEQVVSIEQVSSVAMRPDGGHVAYTLSKPRSSDDRPGGNYSELWLVAQGSNSPQRIIAAPQSAFGPTWSSDGSMLAFRANLDQHENTQVYAVTVEDHTPRLLTRSPTGVSSFQFAPDGRSIAYTTRDPMSEAEQTRRAQGQDQWVAGEDFWRHVRLWIEDLTTGDRRAVTPEGRTVWAFAWAPGSDRLAVQTTSSPEIDHGYMFRQLATVSATGGALRPLTETPGKLGGMAWSPDGERLAYTALVEGQFQLLVSRARPGEKPVVLTTGHGMEQALGSFTPDGRAILFRQHSNIDKEGDLLLVDADGESEPEAFLTGPTNDGFPRLSPDGRWAAFLTYAGAISQGGEISIADFPEAGGRWQITKAGVATPNSWGWLGDRELYWQDPERRVWALSFSLRDGGEPEIGAPRPLLDGRPLDNGTVIHDHSRMRERFLVGRLAGPTPRARLVVVSDWRAGLKIGNEGS